METLRKKAGNGPHCVPEATGDVMSLDCRLLSTETELLASVPKTDVLSETEMTGSKCLFPCRA